MRVEIESDLIDSRLLDWYLGVGVAVVQIGRLSLQRPDLEIKLNNGLLTLGYVGKEPTCQVGIRHVELTTYNWELLADLVATFPKEE